MSKTTRRDLLKVAGAGGIAAGIGMVTSAKSRTAKTTRSKGHHHKPISGPLASATVSFGQWQTGPTDANYPGPAGPEFDRTDPVVMTPMGPAGGPNDRFRNSHQLIPNEVTIKAGGSVNFLIAGLHQIVIYGDGTKPGDIDINDLAESPAPFPPLIKDDTNRIYRGLNPILIPNNQDRLEVVQFAEAGLYLVICALLPHFQDEMYGWVKVVR